MKQTDQYGLNQWELSDRIQMEDFNADNLKIAAALAGLDAGKMGKIYPIKQSANHEGFQSMSTSYLKYSSWNDWDVVAAYFAPTDETGTYQEQEFSMNVTISKQRVIRPLESSPFFLLLFPLHDENRPLSGLFITKSGAELIADSGPFKDIKYCTFKPTVNCPSHHVFRIYGIR